MSKSVTMATWDDVPHLTAQDKADMLANIPEWQRDARSKGVPQLGSGAIYPVPEDDIVIEPFPIPAHWPRGYALDVGWNCTAAVFGAIDRETGVLYVYDEHYRGKAEPATHAAAIRSRGEWLPGVIDPASRGRGQRDGEQLLQAYRDLGLNLTLADNGVEAGLTACWIRLSQGRLRVFKPLANLRAEYRLYRRDERGNIVKKQDHALDALRYLVVSGVNRMAVDPNLFGRMGRAGAVLSDYDPVP